MPDVRRALQARADLCAKARAFFRSRDVLEVDTPILGRGLIVEKGIEPIACSRGRFLLASPEGPMKRLLAAGSGAIYQWAHAFRDGEVGQRHAEEFTMLEWYRPGLDHHALMDEVEDLVRTLLPGTGASPFLRTTYREVFVAGAGVDPHRCTREQVREVSERLGVPLPSSSAEESLDDALDLLLTQHLEPSLGRPAPQFVYDYPASQAALARLSPSEAHLASRFELYVDGVELANGYHELADAVEQASRLESANAARLASGLAPLPVDESLLAALRSGGFPDCAGVALGFDRLLMLAMGAGHIEDVRGLPFG